MLFNYMAIKTFNIDEEVYNQFSKYCKKNGISMSKRIENFIRGEISKLKSNPIENKLSENLIQKKDHSFSKYC